MDPRGPRLDYLDHRRDPGAWARALGVSRAAVDLYLASEVIDLHIDSFLWTRLAGYDLTRRHGRGIFGARFYSQVDLPRLREAQVTGGAFAITTNPLRSPEGRARAFAANLARLQRVLRSVPGEVALVRTTAEYRAARAKGLFGAFLAVQGGNAVDRDADAVALLGGGGAEAARYPAVVRVTLVHLSNSGLGGSSAPLSGGRGLTAAGREFVHRLDHRRIFVDLAHVSRQGFWDALEAHDRALPAIVTHTGVEGVHRHWRNLDDAQLKAIAATGGTVGVIYHSGFLGDPLLGGRAETVVRHLEHVVRVAGDDFASLGSDWDGLIVPPRDLPTCLELPRLVQIMLDRGWSEPRVVKVLGANFLRALALLRPPTAPGPTGRAASR